MSEAYAQLSYPVVAWYDGYIYLAVKPLDLCAHPRSLFAETVQRSREGKLHLMDASGHCFDVVDWQIVPPFRGGKSIALRLLRSVFAVPVLANKVALPLPDFKKKLLAALRSRYKHDRDKGPVAEAKRKLDQADSYRSAVAALPKL
jgi:hypothetical protein